MSKMIYFRLNGCDIAFDAMAPEDITLKDLLRLCDRIEPDYCACGICSLKESDLRMNNNHIDLIFDYNSVMRSPTCEYPSFKIHDKGDGFHPIYGRGGDNNDA